MSNKQAWEDAKEELKSRLLIYLDSQGVTSGNGKSFRCINPDHNDEVPSAGIIPASDGRLFHCFSCGITGDIFTAAHLLEGKPTEGRGFISDNLVYLATRFSVKVPTVELSAEELTEMETYSAYHHASLIVRNSKPSPLVEERLKRYAWPEAVLKRIGVGSVESYEGYLERMTKHYGHQRAFLRDIDLTRKDIFSPDRLIYTLRNVHGAPVGFGARDLHYEDKISEYKRQRAEIIDAEGLESSKLDDLRKPTKYVNSDACNRIYRKSEILFNLDAAKDYLPIWVFEGYSDAVSLYAGGIKGSVAIGSTAFTAEHLQILLELKARHIVFVLDADHAGVEGTNRVVKMLEESVGGHVGLRVEIVAMPPGTDDPDAYVHKFPSLIEGANSFRQLERIDSFSWSLKQQISQGQDPEVVAETTIPLIVNNGNYLQRMGMVTRLAHVTGLDETYLRREVLRQVDSDAAQIEEDKMLLAKRIATAMTREPAKLEALLESARSQLQAMEKKRLGYDPKNTIADLTTVFDRARNSVNRVDLETGYPILDNAINGIPRRETFISVPGSPNAGKSTFFDNLAVRLIENNPDCMVLFHTIDDSLAVQTARLFGVRNKIDCNYFKRAGYWMHHREDFEQKYSESTRWLLDLAEDERLIIVDPSRLPGTLPGLQSYVRTLRNRYPNRSLVVLADNFHKYDLPGYEPGETRTREMSNFVKNMANIDDCTCLFTMELPKDSLRPGVRPRIGRIKGTSGMAYDANANLGIYNDMKSRPTGHTVFWSDGNTLDPVFDAQGVETRVPRKKPIIEVVIDKSKLSDFDGTVFFRLDPASGFMEECNESQQREYSLMAEDSSHGGETTSYARAERAPF